MRQICINSRHKGGRVFSERLMSIVNENHGGPYQKSSFIGFLVAIATAVDEPDEFSEV